MVDLFLMVWIVILDMSLVFVWWLLPQGTLKNFKKKTVVIPVDYRLYILVT